MEVLRGVRNTSSLTDWKTYLRLRCDADALLLNDELGCKGDRVRELGAREAARAVRNLDTLACALARAGLDVGEDIWSVETCPLDQHQSVRHSMSTARWLVNMNHIFVTGAHSQLRDPVFYVSVNMTLAYSKILINE